MDDIGVKAIVIGVSIFVTLMIVTVIILEFTHISDIYKNAEQTDVSFEKRFNELDKFRDPNNKFTILDVKNYIKKYANDDMIEVCIGLNCDDMSNISSVEDYRTVYREYRANLESIDNKYRIIFNVI